MELKKSSAGDGFLGAGWSVAGLKFDAGQGGGGGRSRGLLERFGWMVEVVGRGDPCRRLPNLQPVGLGHVAAVDRDVDLVPARAGRCPVGAVRAVVVGTNQHVFRLALNAWRGISAAWKFFVSIDRPFFDTFRLLSR